MGIGKKGELRIEHKALAAHLIQAALRYHNLLIYVNGREHHPDEHTQQQIKKYEAQRDEVLKWAKELDPDSIIIYTEYIQSRQRAINAWRR